ncbi:TPA: response regulator [Candidatus Woesearchaeota archaeon]|nr:response regulator [Candidatus Woesearchaeota archaeon]HII69597.1 response regulator [Candidatus Woesearchaeota archaeon]
MQKKILIVDDNSDLLHSVIFSLQRLDLKKEKEFLRAESGKECLKIVEKQKPDLILLDIMMPKMDGWQVATKIKENKKWRDIPIIFLTAKRDKMSIETGSASAVDYVCKPFDAEDLMKRIDKAIKQSKKK